MSDPCGHVDYAATSVETDSLTERPTLRKVYVTAGPAAPGRSDGASREAPTGVPSRRQPPQRVPRRNRAAAAPADTRAMPTVQARAGTRCPAAGWPSSSARIVSVTAVTG